MKAKLLSYSQAAEGEFGELSDIQDLVAYCARVSNPSNQMNTETSEKLLNYLAKHRHWSPFEMVSVCLEVETTRDIARQLLRHRSFSFQEFSQRYANPLDDLEYETREARLQDEKNRQNSVEIDDPEMQDEWAWQQEQVINASTRAYRWAINNGIAKEQARAVLPEGLMVSRLYVNGTLRSWMHYIDLRSANGTQKEHIELAQEIARAIHLIYPTIDKYVNS